MPTTLRAPERDNKSVNPTSMIILPRATLGAVNLAGALQQVIRGTNRGAIFVLKPTDRMNETIRLIRAAVKWSKQSTVRVYRINTLMLESLRYEEGYVFVFTDQKPLGYNITFLEHFD